jgi:N-methylhydantoinase A
VSPGVLCALGDATTRMRAETARSYSKLISRSSDADVAALLESMGAQVRDTLIADGIPAGEIELRFEADLRYAGQAFEVPLPVQQADFNAGKGLAAVDAAFHAAHQKLFTFSMDTETELVNLRAIALGKAPELPALELKEGNGNPIAAKLRDHAMWADGGFKPAVCEMDSTTVILAGFAGKVDRHGNILINPV